MNTHKCPSRGSIAIAVRTEPNTSSGGATVKIGRRKQRDRLPAVAQQHLARRQGGMGGERIDRNDMRRVGRPVIGERPNRQPESDRRIARKQEKALAPEAPALGDPASPARLAVPDLDWHDIAGRFVEAAFENPDDARPLLRVFQLVGGGVDIERQLLLDQKEMRGVLISGHG